jgi:hypothetical protein
VPPHLLVHPLSEEAVLALIVHTAATSASSSAMQVEAWVVIFGLTRIALRQLSEKLIFRRSDKPLEIDPRQNAQVRKRFEYTSELFNIVH